jgi:hypothetical protein
MEIRPFAKAREFVHGLNLKKSTEWRTFSKSGKRPPDIPSSPDKVYKDEWKGWGDWLGTGIISNSECVATIIKTRDLLLLFPQFAVLVFLHLPYRTFHHHNHNLAP